MPNFLVSAATGALSPVLHKLADLLSDEYKRFKGVRGEVKFLIRELEAMHAFLLKKSEEENPDAQEKAWMKEVRELSYDIEDSLDDFRVRVDDDSAKPDGFIDKCKNLLKKTKARHQIAKAIQDLKVQVKEVSERNARYKQIGDTVMNTSKVTVDPRALAIFDDASRLVGINQPKQEIISFLKEGDGGTSSQQPKIVSIVGIGGIGKTTLANRVYQELKDQFHCRVFLSVSRNPDLANILRTILSVVTGQPYYKTEAGSIQQLVLQINEFLRTKRYFIVIDDVWDMEAWDTIKYALSNNSCGSVIITTTRIHDVAKACCSLYSDGWVYRTKPLRARDSKRLFQNRIFGPGNECPEYLKEVSDKILRKCGGLPLAIITISGLLANKARNGVHSVIDWEQVQTSIGHGLERDSTVEGMMGILSLSYFDLPHHLKTCLLYLSIFPEDYKIKKQRLVRLWVAEGFIPAESTFTLYESGEKSFNELINRNLILPGEMNEWTSEVKSCHLHDTILDFIVSKSTEENFVMVHGIPKPTSPPPGIKVRRLSLQGETEGDVTLHSNQNYANIRSVIIFGSPCSALLGVRFLRVLDFTACQRLENQLLANIGELVQLRYLGLRDTRITELPEQIGALQYLETLDLGGCGIIQLPTSIFRLKRLVNLLMDPRMLNCIPSGIKNMQALEVFSAVYLDINAAAIYFEEIGNLTKMRHLDIALVSNSGTIDEESCMDLIKKMVASIHRLTKLYTLYINFLGAVDVTKRIVSGEAGHAAILEVPWCSASLRMLVFMVSPMSRVPCWMKSLVNIEQLMLRLKNLDQESHCILGSLPVLVDLRLEIVSNVEGIHSTDKQRLVVSNRHGYRSLRHFSIHVLKLIPVSRPSIPMLTFEAGSMPMLEELRIDFDADITISLSNGRLDFGLNHLSQLKKVKCHMFGTKLNILRVEVAIEKELGNHPKLPSLYKVHYPLTEGERSNRECLRPRRRSQSTQPKPPSVADLSEQQVVQEPADDALVCTSGRGVKRRFQLLNAALSLPTEVSFTIHHYQLLNAALPLPTEVSFTIHHDQLLNAALPLPTEVSFTIHHDRTFPDIGRRHRQQWYKPKFRQGATIRGRELVQGAPVVPDRVKGTSGASTATSDGLRHRLIDAPQQQMAFVPPCFTFSSGSPPNAEAEQQTTHCYELSQHEDLANAFTSTFNNAFTSTFNGLSLRNDHPSSSATTVQVSPLDTVPSDVLGPPFLAAPQQQEAFVPPCFTFSSRSLPNAQAEQHAMDCYKPSQRDDLANPFSSALDRLSLGNGHPGSSATAVEAASSNTGAAPTSDVLGPQHIAARQQHELVAPCFTFSSGSPPIAEAEEESMDSYDPSQHDDLANAFSSAFNGLSLQDDNPGSSATSVEAASSGAKTQTIMLYVGCSSCQGGGRQEQH